MNAIHAEIARLEALRDMQQAIIDVATRARDAINGQAEALKATVSGSHVASGVRRHNGKAVCHLCGKPMGEESGETHLVCEQREQHEADRR